MFAAATVRAVALFTIAVAVGQGSQTVALANVRVDATSGHNVQVSPLWAQRSLASSSRAAVARVVSTATADVVLLSGGHNEGFRDGMACEIYRGNELIAELMIVRCETERSAALITALKAGSGIVPGDVANIKTVHPF